MREAARLEMCGSATYRRQHGPDCAPDELHRLLTAEPRTGRRRLWFCVESSVAIYRLFRSPGKLRATGLHCLGLVRLGRVGASQYHREMFRELWRSWSPAA